MSSEAKPLFLFIARSSGPSHGDAAKTKAFLQKSLQYTHKVYQKVYGQLDPNLVSFWVFIQSSNRSFSGHGETVATIRKVLEQGKSEKRPVVLVVNGWDGLSTNPVALANLFAPFIDEVQITLEAFVDTPRVFRRVSVSHAIKVLSGEYDEEFDKLVLPHSTLEYCRKVEVIRNIKMNISENIARLKEESANRNTIPGSDDKWVCEICEAPFRTSSLLNSHTHSVHPTESERKRLICPHCGQEFSRSDHRKNHVEGAVCKENPNYAAKQAEKSAIKRAPRGSKRTRTELRNEQATSSDGGPPSYYKIQTNTMNFPRVDPSLPFDQRIIYKDEIFCRYHGCCHKTAFSEPTNLRTHYEQKHKFFYPPQSRSVQPGWKTFEEEGIQYLARCAHYGSDKVDIVGSPPVPPVRKPKKARTIADGDGSPDGEEDSVDRGISIDPPD